MKKIGLTFAVIMAAAGLAFGQSPAINKFFSQLESMNDKMSAAMVSDNKAAIEGVYMEIAELYDQQSREVKDAAAPMIGGVWYNIAAMRSLQNNTDGALEALSKAVDYGWNDYRQTIHDPDMAAIRNTARFKELAAKIR